METAQRVDTLITAYENYCAEVSEHYDEVVFDVIERVERAGCLSKTDIAALVSWKRLRANAPWMRDLMGTADARVREVTEQAVCIAGDEARETHRAAADARSALSELDGFGTGDALASTVCFVAAPDRLAVYDSRAHRGLGAVGLELTDRPGRYGRYIELVEGCRDELRQSGRAWKARQVDLALYQLGGRPSDGAARA